MMKNKKKTINIKTIIKDNISYSIELQNFVENIRLKMKSKNINEEKEILNEISMKINESKGNPILLELLCDFFGTY